MTVATDLAYGSLSETAHAQMLECHPLWVHATDRKNFATIKQQGLRPWDEVGRITSPSSECTPRAGCVYLCSAANFEHASVMAGDHDGLAFIAVDISGIERARILPDEDDWSPLMGGYYDPAEFGVPPYDGKRLNSGGEWAEAVRLGEQPGSCELSVASEKIAVRGTIATALLEFEPRDDHPYASTFWLDDLQAKRRGDFDALASKQRRARSLAALRGAGV